MGKACVVAATAALLVCGSALADYSYEYYEGDWSVLPDFDALTPVQSGTAPDLDISLRLRDSQYGFRFTGTVTAAVADTYTFYTNSDDGSRLYIDGALVVDNDGLHAPRQASGAVALTAGTHDIVVTFFEQGGGEVLEVSWSNSSNGQQAIPADGVIGEQPNVAAEGQWGPVIPWPHVAVSAANLPDGRILTWSGSERATWPSTEQTYSGTWDPETGEFVEIFHDGHNMFCAHLAMAEDGRVFVNGGRNQTNSPWTSLFDYRDSSWTQIENMESGGRWYPTTIALTDGNIFTAIGTATNQRYPDKWDPDAGWAIQNGIDFNDMVLDDYFSTGTHGESHWWPLLHVAPNGKLFHSGPTPQMHWINTAGAGSYEPVGDAFTDWYHKHGTTVMYDEGKLLTAGGWLAGGNTRSTDQAFTVDINGPTPVVQLTNPMNHARKFQNGVVLPTGEVLVVGGNTSGRKFSDDGSILVAEMWDPATEIWTELAPMTIPRNYHSVALLLNDGRVLAAGSGYNAGSIPASTHQDGQVFSPPYLFNADGSPATRPVISSATGVADVGTTFRVSSSQPIDYFSLIKMSSTTHGLNTDVRYLRPQFENGGGNDYDVTLHANPNVATPGYWMLFAVNASGVPSEAHVIRITAVDTRLENLALSGVASQSSDLSAGADVGAENAVDGDLTGAESSGSLAMTNADTNAWWEIDLGAVHNVDTVRIWNRTDCCADRLSDYYVLTSQSPFVSQDLAETLSQPGVQQHFMPGSAPSQTDLAVDGNARFVRIQLSGTNNLQLPEVQIFGSEATVEQPAPVLENGTLANVGSDWQTVTLARTYVDPVVIASAKYDGTQLPAVTRVRNAAANQFDIRVQNPSDTPLAGYEVSYLVAEAGVYDAGGLKMEAVKFDSSVTDNASSWVAEQRAYQQAYIDPVVVGQVMSDNDARWSVFWASDGVTGNPPSATSLRVGKQVAEDPVRTRNNETIGYIVIETGTGNVDGVGIEAAVGANTIEGVVEAAPYTYALTNPHEVAVVSSAGMNGTNGGWPVVFDAPASATELHMGIDEDQLRDSERNRIDDQVAYIAMTRSINGIIVNSVSDEPRVAGTESAFIVDAIAPTGLQYSWNFGDGNTPFSSDNSATHTFSQPGRHVVTVTVRDEEGNEQQITFVQLVHLPLTSGSPVASTGVVEYGSRGEVWNVNPDNDSVTVIDPAMEAIVAEIGVARDPRGLAIAPDGRVWVTNKGSDVVSIIDPASRSVVQMVLLDVGGQPHGIVMGSTEAYLVLEGSGVVVAVDALTGVELRRTVVGGRPRHISMDADAANLFVSRFVTPPLPGESTDAPIVDDGANLYGGEIVVLDPATLIQTNTVVLQHSDRLVSEHTGPGVPNYLGPAVVSPDGSAAWVPSKQDNILAGALRGGQGMTFDQTVRAISSKIALPGQVEVFPMRTDHDNASVASHAAFGPLGIHVFSALEGNREVAVIDAHSGVEVMRFDVGRAPQSVAVSADGRRLYVHNFMDRSLGIYDVSSLVSSGAITVSEIATIGTVSSESLAPDVFVGKQLFYDARDDRLAALDYMSCASCHNAGSDDGRVWDFTGVGEGLRNTISLNGRAGMAHGFLHWSANFDEIQDFEGQIRFVAGGLGLMDDADFNSGTRYEPLGDPKAGFSADLDALAAYVTSLDEAPVSPFRGADRELSPDALAGVALYDSAGCSGCHVPLSLTDSSDGLGLHDVGTITANSGQRLFGTLPGLDTPTLVGVWKTAPYLHDGSQPTLRGAIAAHSGVVLSDTELDQLAALMQELDHGSDVSTSSVGPSLHSGVVANVGSDWQTVTLPRSYEDMVVIASPQYAYPANPAVTRIRNATGNQFDVRVQNPSGSPLAGYTVHFLVAEAGVYNVAEHGIAMEAVKTGSAAVNRRKNWTPTPTGYAQSYADPIVVGQVMTANDSRWSVFWASNGSSATPPMPGALAVASHIGEDSDTSRIGETLGYMVFEAGSGSTGGIDVLAGRTGDSVRGVDRGPYATGIGGQYTSAVVSSAAMDGGNGGWPILQGTDPLAGDQIDIGIDEDQISDAERAHTTEEVAYVLTR